MKTNLPSRIKTARSFIDFIPAGQYVNVQVTVRATGHTFDQGYNLNFILQDRQNRPIKNPLRHIARHLSRDHQNALIKDREAERDEFFGCMNFWSDLKSATSRKKRYYSVKAARSARLKAEKAARELAAFRELLKANGL